LKDEDLLNKEIDSWNPFDASLDESPTIQFNTKKIVKKIAIYWFNEKKIEG